jgi:hypothetical protein
MQGTGLSGVDSLAVTRQTQNHEVVLGIVMCNPIFVMDLKIVVVLDCFPTHLALLVSLCKQLDTKIGPTCRSVGQ